MVRVIIELAERDLNLIRLLADELVLTPSAVLSRLLREGIAEQATPSRAAQADQAIVARTPRQPVAVLKRARAEHQQMLARMTPEDRSEYKRLFAVVTNDASPGAERMLELETRYFVPPPDS